MENAVFQAVIPTRQEIPESLQMTVAQVLQALKEKLKLFAQSVEEKADR